MKNSKIRKLTVLAMISALSFIAMFFFRFNVMFLTFDFKDAVMSIATLLYGPFAGVCCTLVVAFLESVTIGDTGIYGLIMDIISSCAFLIPCGIVYKHKRTFSGAIIAAISSVISVVVVMGLANIFITPYYMGVKTSEVINLLPTVLLPFNLSKGLMNAAVMLLIYKPLTNILRKTRLIAPSEHKQGFSKKSLWLVIISVAVLILTAIFLIFVLKGNFVLFEV